MLYTVQVNYVEHQTPQRHHKTHQHSLDLIEVHLLIACQAVLASPDFQKTCNIPLPSRSMLLSIEHCKDIIATMSKDSILREVHQLIDLVSAGCRVENRERSTHSVF